MLVDSGDGELRDAVYEFCDTFGEGLINPLKAFDEWIERKLYIAELKGVSI